MKKNSSSPQIFPNHAKCFWFTGLSGAGKTTLSHALQDYLDSHSILSVLLDGDELRQTLSLDLGYDEASRKENVRRAAEVAKLFLNKGITVMCTFISPTYEARALACEIIGAARFYEIFVSCSIATCIERDVKGIYNRYKNNEIKNISGIDARYEPPLSPFLILKTDHFSLEDCKQQLFDAILPQILSGNDT